MPRQRIANRREIGEQFRRRRIGRKRRLRRERRHHSGQRGSGRGQPCIDADQGLTIRLVLAVRIGVVRRRRQRQQFPRWRDQSRRQRQLGTEAMDLVQIVRKCNRRLRADRARERFADNIRIAVAIAADPRAHAQERRQPNVTRKCEVPVQHVLQRRIELRNLLEKRVAVEGEAILDLVGHLQLRQAQHRGLPQREHLSIQPPVHGVLFVRCERAAVAPLQ